MSRPFSTILKDRRNGLYLTPETLDEASLSFSQMEPNDVAITLIHRAGIFNVYNKKELAAQLTAWKKIKAVCLDSNIFEIMIDNKKAYLFIIQPKTQDDNSISPLALAFNIIVSGYAYIVKKRESAEMIIASLRI